MNTNTRPESMALSQVPAPTALAAGTTSASALMLSGDSMDKMMRIAGFMASAKATIPQHLRNPGDCLAVVMQATQWNMNPFAVAQKTHLVNGTLGYEAQLVAAVINNSGLVKDRFNFEWFGAWEKIVGKFKEVESKTKKDDNGHPKKYIVPAWDQKDEQGLGVRVWATIKGETEPRVLELLMTQARTRNSTLWTEDPKQQIAYLCSRRSVEVRGIMRDGVTDAGMLWQDGKTKGKPPVLIEWTPELRATIAEAAAIKRNKVAGTLYLFGNMQGQRYTKGGWKAVLDDLMFDCVAEAARRKIPFQRFSLQDCRPKGATDKLSSGHTDAKDALGHTTDRMLGQVYDRRPVKKATAVR